MISSTIDFWEVDWRLMVMHRMTCCVVWYLPVDDFSKVTVTHFLSFPPPSEKSSDGPGCRATIKLSSRCLHKGRSNSDERQVSIVRSGETYLFVELFS